jgi:hypothetical protein
MKYYKVTLTLYTEVDPSQCSAEQLSQNATYSDYAIWDDKRVKKLTYNLLPRHLKPFFEKEKSKKRRKTK